MADYTPGKNITTANASVIKIGLRSWDNTNSVWKPATASDPLYVPANFINGEYKDEVTVQDVKVKNSTIGKGVSTYHMITGSGTWQRTEDDPMQLFLLEISEKKIGKDCVVYAEFDCEDGTTRAGFFNVAVNEVGFSGEADALATLEVEFKNAGDDITITYDATVDAALKTLAS